MKVYLLSGVLFLSLYVFPTHAAEIRLHGSSAITENLLVNNKTRIEDNSRHTLLITETTPEDGIMDVAKDISHIFMTTRPFAEVLETVDYERPTDALAASLFTSYKVGDISVVFAVHKENAVRELSTQQITNILNGTVTNWSEVGGADVPVTVIIEKDGGFLRTLVKDELLNEGTLRAKRREVSYAIQIPGFVEALPGAFGVMSAGDMTDTVTQIQTDISITQPIYFVTKGVAPTDVMAVINATKSATGTE